MGSAVEFVPVKQHPPFFGWCRECRARVAAWYLFQTPGCGEPETLTCVFCIDNAAQRARARAAFANAFERLSEEQRFDCNAHYLGVAVARSRRERRKAPTSLVHMLIPKGA